MAALLYVANRHVLPENTTVRGACSYFMILSTVVTGIGNSGIGNSGIGNSAPADFR